MTRKVEPTCHQATPLHTAANSGSTDILEFLMPLLKFNHPKDKKGRTSLHYAAQSGQVEATKSIISLLKQEDHKKSKSKMESTLIHSNLDLKTIHIFECMDDLELNKCKLVCRKWNWLVGLFKCHYEKWLRSTLKENRNPMDNFGWTPLHIAAKEGHLEICELIASQIENRNSRIFKTGNTPLHLAVIEVNIETVEHLIRVNSEKNPSNHEGWTPLHYAVHNGLVNVVKILIPQIEDKSPKDKYIYITSPARTPLCTGRH